MTTATDAGIKAWRNVQARLALAGFKADLLEGDDGRPELVVTRWALVKAFSDLAAAEEFFSRVSGTRPGFATEQESPYVHPSSTAAPQ